MLHSRSPLYSLYSSVLLQLTLSTTIELNSLFKVKVKVTLRLTVSQSVSKSWCRAPSGSHDQIFIIVWQLGSCFFGAPSLTRGRVCLLYMLLALTSAVFLWSKTLELPIIVRLSLYRLGSDATENMCRVSECVFIGRCLALGMARTTQKTLLPILFYCCVRVIR
jgi:hypothetical protein